MTKQAKPGRGRRPTKEAPFQVVKGGEPVEARPVVDPTDPVPTVRLFLQRTGEKLLHQSGSFLAWDGACYPVVPDLEIRAKVYRFLGPCRRRDRDGSLVDFCPNRKKVDDVMDALRAEINLASTLKAPAWIGDSTPDLDPFDCISFQNGLLHIPTRDLRPPTPDFFTFTALPFDYDPDAPPPEHWLAFIEGLWPDDPESVQAQQEWTGLQLTSITWFQKIVLLVGPPRSGKGVIARVTRQLVGPRNYVAVILRSLAGPFGTQPLIGKSVAVVTDARISNRVDGVAIAEKLLAISGEDSPAIQRKNLPDWEGAVSVKFTLQSNELPKLTDASGALSSRLLVLKLTRSHLGEEDLELESRFVPELPGILNWALDGLDRLLKRGRFIQPESGRELLEQVTELGSPIRTFLRERCEIGPGHEVGRGELYNAWVAWCETNGHRQGSTALFGRDLRAALPNLADGWRGQRERVYKGLRLLERSKVASMNPKDWR